MTWDESWFCTASTSYPSWNIIKHRRARSRALLRSDDKWSAKIMTLTHSLARLFVAHSVECEQCTAVGEICINGAKETRGVSSSSSSAASAWASSTSLKQHSNSKYRFAFAVVIVETCALSKCCWFVCDILDRFVWIICKLSNGKQTKEKKRTERKRNEGAKEW